MTRAFLSLFLFFCFITVASSQAVQRYHQSFEVDQVNAIDIQLEGNVQVETWAGNTVLVEVYVTTANGSSAILTHLQKQGRFDLQFIADGNKALLSKKDVIRQPIKTKGVELDETVKYLISIPDSFRTDNTELMRNFTKA